MARKRRNWKVTIPVSILVLLVLMYGLQLVTAPDEVIDDILVFEEGDAVVIQTKFAIPVRYENHFPEGQGKVLQVKVRTVSLTGGDQNQYIGRGALLRGFAERVPLMDVAYEGGVPGGPFVTFRFKRAVHYTIAEDLAERSLLVKIPQGDLTS